MPKKGGKYEGANTKVGKQLKMFNTINWRER
jgi:hypothetical protein